MSIAVTINGARRLGDGGTGTLLIDVTVGTSHQLIPFAEQVVASKGTAAQQIAYVAGVAAGVVSGATNLTTTPAGLEYLQGSTTVTGAQPMAATGVTERTTTTTPDTFAATDAVIYVNATAGNKVLNLPTAVGIDGQRYEAKKIDSSANLVTVTPNGAETIDGAATLVLSKQGASCILTSDGTNWQASRAIALPAAVQTGASAGGIATIADAPAKAAITALQNALAAMGLVTTAA